MNLEAKIKANIATAICIRYLINEYTDIDGLPLCVANLTAAAMLHDLVISKEDWVQLLKNCVYFSDSWTVEKFLSYGDDSLSDLDNRLRVIVEEVFAKIDPAAPDPTHKLNVYL